MRQPKIPIEELGIEVDVYHGLDGSVAVEVNDNIFGSYDEALDEIRKILDNKMSEIKEKHGGRESA